MCDNNNKDENMLPWVITTILVWLIIILTVFSCDINAKNEHCQGILEAKGWVKSKAAEGGKGE